VSRDDDQEIVRPLNVQKKRSLGPLRVREKAKVAPWVSNNGGVAVLGGRGEVQRKKIIPE